MPKPDMLNLRTAESTVTLTEKPQGVDYSRVRDLTLPEYFSLSGIVVASVTKDLPFRHKLPGAYELFVYHSDSTRREDDGYVVNIGDEAGKYLKFVLDHYDDLPDHMLFLHGHEMAYHNVKCSGPNSCWYFNGKKVGDGCRAFAPCSKQECRVSFIDIVESWNWSTPCFRPVPGFMHGLKIGCKGRDIKTCANVAGIKLSSQENGARCSFRSTTNGQFGVSKRCILAHEKNTYERLWKWVTTRTREKGLKLRGLKMDFFRRLKRALGAPPMTDKSQYSRSWLAGGNLEAVQSFRAVGAAAAAQRARGHCDSAFYFGWGYENLTQES